MKFHFTASSHTESRDRLEELIAMYGQNDSEQADVMIGRLPPNPMLQLLFLAEMAKCCIRCEKQFASINLFLA